MKKLTVLFIVLFLATPAVWAQSTQIKQVQIDRNGSISSDQQSTINGNFSDEDFEGLANTFPQIAALNELATDFNQAAIISQNGQQNRSVINQSGGNNRGAINITGNFNQTSLSQVGNDFSVLDVTGSQNDFNIDQQAQGVKNFILLNASGVQFNAVQNASGLILQQQGATGVPLQIKVTGRNIPIKISNN